MDLAVPFASPPSLSARSPTSVLAALWTKADRSFMGALLAVLVLAAIRISYGHTVPMGHEASDFGDTVRAVAGLVLLAVSYGVGSRGWVRTSYVIRATGLGYLLALGMGPCLKQIYWTGRSFPIADHLLASIDSSLGFSWKAYVEAFRGHDLLLKVLWVAYEAILHQPFAIGVFLAYKRMPERLYAFIVQQDVCIALVTLGTLFFPAFGAYHHFGATAQSMPFIPGGDMDQMTLPLQAIRAGFLDIGRVTSLVQFPSYHAAACVLYTAAAWGTRMRYPILALNIVMFASTPIYGSHYLSDMLAGGILAVASIVATRAFFACFVPDPVRGGVERAATCHEAEPSRSDRGERAPAPA